MAYKEPLIPAEGSASRKLVIILGVLVVLLIAATAGVTALYVSKLNSDDGSRVIPSMRRFPNVKNMDMKGKKFLPVVYSMVPGKEMTAGMVELFKGDKVEYTQWFEGFLLVIEGRIEITDGGNKSKTVHAGVGNALYIPRGTKVILTGIERKSRGYWVCHPTGQEISADINDYISQQPSISMMNQTIDSYIGHIPLLPNDFHSNSYLADYLHSNVTGQELAAGMYELEAGPALKYTYTYEEFKYIFSGEFHLTDGAGHSCVAKAGDLMYFPKGVFIRFASPTGALGFFVGQRLADAA